MEGRMEGKGREEETKFLPVIKRERDEISSRSAGFCYVVPLRETGRPAGRPSRESLNIALCVSGVVRQGARAWALVHVTLRTSF